MRLVAGRLAVLADADPQVGVAEADAVAGRRAVAGEALVRARGGSSPASVAGASPPNRTRRTRPRLARRPALGRARPAGPGGSPRAAVAIEHQPWVHPVERVVRRDADRRAASRSGRSARSMLRAARGRVGAAARRRPDRARAVGRLAGARAPPPSGSSRTTSRVPSPSSTSRRTSSTSSRTPGMTSSGATAARPAASTVRVARRRPAPPRASRRRSARSPPGR